MQVGFVTEMNKFHLISTENHHILSDFSMSPDVTVFFSDILHTFASRVYVELKRSHLPSAIPEIRHQDANGLEDSEYYTAHFPIKEVNHAFNCQSTGLL